MRCHLAYRNLRRSGARWIVSLFGIFFASFLMAVQVSLLYGFSLAASRIVDAVNADIWIVARGTPATEFVSAIPERYSYITSGVEGVEAVGRGVATWAPFERQSGNRTSVFLVGVEDGFGGKIPVISTRAAGSGISDGGLLVDETDAENLEFSLAPSHVQIGGKRGHLFGVVSGFSSFLGPPIVLARYHDARRYLRYGASDVSVVLVRTASNYDPARVRDELQKRFADMDVWTTSEFSTRSRIFWLLKTGAGAALSLAAILGFSIGLVLVAQTMYALTTENIEEFATLRAIGASNTDIRSIVLMQSLISGTIGCVMGLAAVGPFVALARSNISWVLVPAWIYVLIPIVIFFLCLLATNIAVRPALTIDPARVFRA
jgi:putative ABC transport system permease protein